MQPRRHLEQGPSIPAVHQIYQLMRRRDLGQSLHKDGPKFWTSRWVPPWRKQHARHPAVETLSGRRYTRRKREAKKIKTCKSARALGRALNGTGDALEGRGHNFVVSKGRSGGATALKQGLRGLSKRISRTPHGSMKPSLRRETVMPCAYLPQSTLKR